MHLGPLLRLRIWVPIVLFAAATLVFFPASGHDDSHITYWPAYTLSHFFTIINYSGDRVEQSSTLLFTLVLALLDKVNPFTIPTLGRLCSLAFAIACIVATKRLADVVIGNSRAASTALYLLATLPYFAFWSTSGMETPLAALLSVSVALGVLHYFRTRQPFPVGVLLVLLLAALVRPESGLVLIACCLLLILCALYPTLRQFLRPSLVVGGMALLSFAMVVSFRVLYFGRPFPQPASVKGGLPSMDDVARGVRYVVGSRHALGVNGIFPFLLPLLCLAAISAWRAGKARYSDSDAVERRLVLVSLIAAQLAFAIAVGGDWMSGGRFLVPVLPLLAVLAADALTTEAALIRRGALAVVLATQTLGIVALGLSAENRSVPIWRGDVAFSGMDMSRFDWFERSNWSNLRHLRSVPVFEQLVERAHASTGRTVRIWTQQAGLVPYYLATAHRGDIAVTDLGGLTDRVLSSCQYVKDRVPSGTQGFVISRLAALSRPDIEQRCGIQPPDFLYALGSAEAFRGWSSDMVIVYRQKLSPYVPGDAQWSPSFIAMRHDVYQAIGSPPPVEAGFDVAATGTSVRTLAD